MVGLDEDRLDRFPHELSGGQRQRIMIALALALEPELVIMDEPTTALDVVTQREIINELLDLRTQFNFAMIFITHDLSLLVELADEIVVMYAGRIVERARADELYEAPRHPYTLGLLNSFPPMSGARRELIGIPGSPPDLTDLPVGCTFPDSCPYVMDRCRRDDPPLSDDARDRSDRWPVGSTTVGRASRFPSNSPAGANAQLRRRSLMSETTSMTEATRTPVQLSARDLTRHFVTRVPGKLLHAKHTVRAVDDVSLDLIGRSSHRRRRRERFGQVRARAHAGAHREPDVRRTVSRRPGDQPRQAPRPWTTPPRCNWSSRTPSPPTTPFTRCSTTSSDPCSFTGRRSTTSKNSPRPP